MWTNSNPTNHVSTNSIPGRSPNLGSPTTGFVAAFRVNGTISDLTSPDVDPDFNLTPVFHGRTLLPVSCLLDAVDVAFQLALGDYEGTMTNLMSFKLESHPQVEIAIIPDPSGLPWKYAVWALNISADYMIRNYKFKSSVWIIRRLELAIGTVIYQVATEALEASKSVSTDVGNTTQSLAQYNDNGTQAPFNIVSALTTPSTITASNDSAKLRIDYQFTGSGITFNECFQTALDMLRELSIFDRSAHVRLQTIGVHSSGLYVTTSGPSTPIPPGSEEIFKYEWLMAVMGQMPGFMVRQRSFREVRVGVFVGEVEVGRVDVQRRKPEVGVGIE